jgi:hypothetical protein
MKNQKLGKQASYRATRSQQFDIDEKWIVHQRIYASLAKAVQNHYHFSHKVNNSKWRKDRRKGDKTLRN